MADHYLPCQLWIMYWLFWDSDDRYPVIGWRVTGEGVIAPVLPVQKKTHVAGAGVLLGTGETCDLWTGRMFESEDDWRSYWATNPPVEVTEISSLTFQFTGKAFAKSTFWRVTKPGHGAVFTLPGGLPSPVGEWVEKCTRVEYNADRMHAPERPWGFFRAAELPDPAQPLLPFDGADDDIDDMI